MYQSVNQLQYQTGISMIDILVGMAISMLAMLLILNLSVVFESRRAATVDGSETQINAANIFSMMQRDMRLAGYGLSPMEVWGCTVKRHYINSKMDLTLNPIKIIDGVNGAPDSVQILASSKNESGASYVLINHHPASATTMLLNSNLGLAINDILILQEAGKNCTMFQVTNVANDGIRIKHEGVSSPWNPDLPETLFPKEGYGAASNIINLGKVFDRKYSINNRNELQLENYLSDDDSKSLLTITSNIINIDE